MRGSASEGSRDRLTVHALKVMAHIGVTEEERRERQRLEVDVELFADLESAGRSGDLSCTIDYRQVADGLRGLLEGRPWHLVEAAARASLDLLLERFPSADRAVVRVRKYVLPDTAHVEIAMERRR
ncbi:MAG TPA: dihydroneopterin aldolase [Candidatus Polarisedimenticolia bacterium]|nr:dihydroneopterin aldolase [Candidatus Polarisedimenticolia bacterium]